MRRVLTTPAHSKAFVGQVSGYDAGDRTYPHRNRPTGENYFPFEGQPQGMSDRDDEKDCAGQEKKHVFVHFLHLRRGWTCGPLTHSTPFAGKGMQGERRTRM